MRQGELAARPSRTVPARWPLAALLALVVCLAHVAPAEAFVYWTNRNVSTIGRANLDGSAANQSFITGGNLTDGIAVDTTHIYWANESTGAIGRANLDGSGVNHSFITGAAAPRGVAVDASHIYWANLNSSSIGRANLDGTGANQSFITAATPMGVAVNATHIYWANLNPGSGSIGRANLDGTGPNQNFITGTTTPSGIAVDATHVYWSNQTINTLGRANLDGTGANQSFITGANAPIGIAANSAHLFWVNQGLSTIGRANLDGTGANQSFITGATVPFGVALDPEPPVDPPPGDPPPGDPPPITTLPPPFPSQVLPDPVLGVSTNVEPVRGEVLVGVRTRGATVSRGAHAAQLKGVTFVPLTEARQIPVGSFLDTRKGTVSLTSAADKAGNTQDGLFSNGLFQVLQARNAKGGLTELRLKGSSFSNCRVSGRGKRGRGSARAAARKRLKSSTKRSLSGNADGSYRTRGRHSAATVRGTIWTVADRCDGTLTKVKRGKVSVRDFRRKRTIVLKAGKRYLAKAG